MLKDAALILTFLLGFQVVAKVPSVAEVESTLANYRANQTFQAHIKKTIKQGLLSEDSQKVSEGNFYFSKGRLRMDIEKPEPTKLVYDGQTIWFESRMEVDGKNKFVVTKMKSKEIKKSDSLLAVLFDRKDILNSFTLAKAKEVEGDKTYLFVPKDKKKSEVQKLEITINPRAKLIQKILYEDSIENVVSIEFLETEITDVPATKFQYKPPKGADITEI